MMRAPRWIGVALAAALGLLLWLAWPDLPAPAPAPPGVEHAGGAPAAEGSAAGLEAGPGELAPERRPAEPAPPAGRPADDGATWLLALSTRTAIARGQPVPYVAVEAGVGAALDPGVQPLARGVTDGAGEIGLELPRGALEAARLAGQPLWARVAGEGYKRHPRSIPVPRLREPHAITLTVARGCTVRGRLLDAAGAPVAGRVNAIPLGGAGGPGSAGKAGEDGWFELHLRAGGRYDVTAEAGDAGSAALRGHLLECSAPPQRIELVARGPGVVRGHVRGASGGPAAHLDLLVLAAQLDDGQGTFPPAGRGRALSLEGLGRPWAILTTDAHGRFEARGLTAAPHVVRARTGVGLGYPHRLTPSAVPAAGEPLELRFPRPHLAVGVVDAAGLPLEEALEVQQGWGRIDAWPERRAVAVVPVVEEAHVAHLAGPELLRVSGKAGEPGTAVFEVEGGRSYQVGLLGPGQPWRPRVVRVPEGSDRVDVVLVAEELGMGEIALSVACRRGAELREHIDLRILDLATGAPLLQRDGFHGASWPLRIALPGGDYRLAVDGAAFRGWHGELLSPRAHGRFEARVQVVPGRATPVAATLPEGARLLLRLRGEVLEEDRRATRERLAGMTYDLEHFASRPSLALRDEDGWPVALSFQEEGSPFGHGLAASLPLGAERSSELLPAGRYLLEARMPGGRAASAPVVLVDGQTAEATLAFD